MAVSQCPAYLIQPNLLHKHNPSDANTFFLKFLLDFPVGSAGKESACDAGDLSSIPGLGKSPGEGKSTHSSILESKSTVQQGLSSLTRDRNCTSCSGSTETLHWTVREAPRGRHVQQCVRTFWDSQVALQVKKLLANAGEVSGFDPWVRKILWRRSW